MHPGKLPVEMPLRGRLRAQVRGGLREVVMAMITEAVHGDLQPVIGGPGYRQVPGGQGPDPGRGGRLCGA
jgi:hypothetical protein